MRKVAHAQKIKKKTDNKKSKKTNKTAIQKRPVGALKYSKFFSFKSFRFVSEFLVLY